MAETVEQDNTKVNGGISNGEAVAMEETVEKDNSEVNGGISNGEAVATSVSTGGGLRTMAINDTKAGMEGIDREKINQIIQDASKGSKFYMHQQKSQEKLNLRIQCLHQAYKGLSQVQIQRAVAIMDNKAQKMQDERVLDRTIIHVDMDAYFAAVEMRDNAELRNVPMAVGGDSMLSTSNYLARRFGVRAGMPGFIGKKLCPELVIVPGNYEKYGAVSQEIQEVFKEYDANFSCVSLDEAYLDITDYLENKNSLQSDSQMLTPEDVTNEIRGKIFQRTQLTASAGIAANSLLAKICGDINKPNGQYYLQPTVEDIHEFIIGLPIRKVSGIGNVTEQLLNSLNIFTCGDLWENRGIIYLLFKPATVSFLLAVSLGIGNSWLSVADTTEHQKSISSERTFSGSGTNIEPDLCQTLCMDLERELISKDLKARTVTLKIKTVNFEVKSRAVNLLVATNESDIIFETAWGIYKSYVNQVKNLAIRLLGVRLSNFESSNGEAIDQLKPMKQERIDHMFLKLNAKEASEGSIPKYECPICCDEFFVYKKLENHVHHCVSRSEAIKVEKFENNMVKVLDLATRNELEFAKANYSDPKPGRSSAAMKAEELLNEKRKYLTSNDWSNTSSSTELERNSLESMDQERLILTIESNMTEDNIPKYECPICYVKFFVYNQLENHVHNCISRSEATDGENLASNIDGPLNLVMTDECESSKVIYNYSKPGCSSATMQAEDLTEIVLHDALQHLITSNDWPNTSSSTELERNAFESEASTKHPSFEFSKSLDQERLLNIESNMTEDNIPKYECPICYVKFFIYHQLENHVHNCILRSEATDGENLESNIVRPWDLVTTNECESSKVIYNDPKPGCSSAAMKTEDLTGIALNEEPQNLVTSNDWPSTSSSTNLERKTLESESPKKALSFGFSKSKDKKRLLNIESTNAHPGNGNKRRKNDLSMKTGKITDYIYTKDNDSKM